MARSSGTCSEAICRPENQAKAFDQIALAVAAFENSPQMNPFSSKYDAFLERRAQLTHRERVGLAVFKGKAKVLEPATSSTASARCSPTSPTTTWACHGIERTRGTRWPNFNPQGRAWVDEGLGGFLRTRTDYAGYAADNLGKQKVPTLRNVDKRPDPRFTKNYMHNGYFKTLEGVVHFYNTRDVKPVCPDPFTTEAEALARNCWPAPEVPVNVNRDELGNLGLTSDEERALVAFMKTLNDGFRGGTGLE